MLYFPGPEKNKAINIEKYTKAFSGLPVPVMCFMPAMNIVNASKKVEGFVKKPKKINIAQIDSEKDAAKPKKIFILSIEIFKY